MSFNPERETTNLGDKSQEDIEFFNQLAEKYGIKQDEEYFIIENGTRKTFIHKRREIPTNNGSVRIEEYIKRILKEKAKNT